MKNLTVRRFIALSLTLLSVFFVGNSALGAGGTTIVVIQDVVTMTVEDIADFTAIVAADIVLGTKSLTAAWTVQVDAISNYTLNVQLVTAFDDAATPVAIDPTSLSIAAGIASTGGTALSSTAFTGLGANIALAGGSLPFSGVNSAGDNDLSSIDLAIDLRKLGDRTTADPGKTITYTLDFIVLEA